MFHKLIGYIAIMSLIAVCITGCNVKNGKIEFKEQVIKDNVYLENNNFGGLKKSDAAEKIMKSAQESDIQVREAKLNGRTWEIEEKEKNGKKLNLDKTLNLLLNAKEGDRVNFVFEGVEPQITEEKLKKNIRLIGSFTTRLMDKQDSRINNIEIAAEDIDYQIIEPGEEFSFNNSLGKRTKSKGYEVAPIIKKTEEGYKKGYGVGGGICQLSSTLFNAVEEGGLEVTERHVHSKEVGYIAKGRDATVSYGSVDFKFRNNSRYPVMIRTFIGSSNVTVKILENRN